MALTRTSTILSAIALTGGLLMAEPDDPLERDKCPCQLVSLEIKFPKKEIKAGEKVKWEVVFTNKSSRPISFYWTTDPFFEFVTLTFRNLDTGEMSVVDIYKCSPFSPEWKVYTLYPGESRSQPFDGLTHEPGTRLISAEFHYLGIRTKAKPVIVKVIPEK